MKYEPMNITANIQERFLQVTDKDGKPLSDAMGIYYSQAYVDKLRRQIAAYKGVITKLRKEGK